VRVRALRQLHFRNLVTPEVHVPDGVTCIVGRNAAGKSNLIDALYLGCTGSLPSATVVEALRFGESGGYVRVELNVDDEARIVEIGLAAGRKSVRLDGQAARAAEVARLGGAVKVAPEDADLIHGPPAGRRGFLDDLLARLSLRYALMQREYHRVVEQRNAVLKGTGSAATLPVWDDRFLELGGEIDDLRRRVLTRLAPLAARAYADVAGDGKHLGLALRRAAGAASLPEALLAHRAEERARGVTVVGPHRDDLTLTLEGHEVRAYGSRGEARTAALALRVAEFALLEERHGTPPLLLVDDVSAELDGDRRGFLMALARRTPQAVVTGTDAPPGADRVWHVADGRLEVHDA
jgi:DNA replication and repair protein RecF